MSDELTWMPAWRIRELIGTGDVSPVEVVDHFLGRIEDLDPKVHAFSHLDAAGARVQAKQAEDAARRGDEVGPLHGIPTAVKEHIAVRGMPGMSFLGGGAESGRRDHFGIARLRDAGAIVVGMNTMMGSGGQLGGGGGGLFRSFNWDVEARNPWDTSKVPGWSSSGGAASVAAALLPFTIGSDGGGSTRLPAAYSGVVGIHPTGGLIPDTDYEAPTAPLSMPSAPLATTIGPLTRDVRDCAIVTQVMGGPDGRDALCLPFDPPSFTDHLDDGVEGWRFAWTDDFGFASVYASDDSPRVIAHIREAAAGLASLGATVEPTAQVWEDPSPRMHLTGMAYGRPMPGVEPPSAEVLQDAFEARGRNDAITRELLHTNTLLLAPTSQRVARSVEEWNAGWTTDGDKFHGGNFAPTYTADTFIFNWLKYPAISVPCGFVDGLPVGLQIIGLPGREDLVFRAAQAFLRAFPRDERPSVS